MPSVTRSVAAASAASVVQPSSTGDAGSGTPRRWSLTQTSSYPPLGAQRDVADLGEAAAEERQHDAEPRRRRAGASARSGIGVVPWALPRHPAGV